MGYTVNRKGTGAAKTSFCENYYSKTGVHVVPYPKEGKMIEFSPFEILCEESVEKKNPYSFERRVC